VSAVYPQLDYLYGEKSAFVLFKESYETIEKQLMYGYYNNCYDKHVLTDFKKYWGVNFEQNLDGLEDRINKYYNDVESYFAEKENFISQDITKFGGKWNDFMLSPDFLNFLVKLPFDSELLISEGVAAQEKVATGRVGMSDDVPLEDVLLEKAVLKA
jgi:hypothetical protein